MDVEVLSEAIHQLLDRLDVARKRDEVVVKHVDYYETDLGDGIRLFSVLFEPNCLVPLDHDLAQRLMRTLDQVIQFDDADLSEYDAEFEGRLRLAPGAAWAHACCSEGRQIAVLPLPLDDVPGGRIPVTVADAIVGIFFVLAESHHVAFFRAVIALEKADEAMFERLATSAFPALEWADGIWNGLGDFSRPYIAVRDELIRHLGGLSDYGANCFHQYLADGPDELPRVLSTRVGAETSDENGVTKRHKPSEQDRTRPHRGVNKVFWWHVKLRPNVDRVYFLYEPPSMNPPIPEPGRIVVGRFTDHCVLPR
ncbi:MAG: hypothetical protein OXH63_23695 [Gemmatimonadetes bacterium]|nr:hypothetical protein [Gemmatimonadota bacterium]